MKSLLSRLMGLLIGISLIAGILIFAFLKETNQQEITNQKLQELRTNKTIIQNQLHLLYRTIFYAYAKDYNSFQRVVKVTKDKFIHDIKSSHIFKSEGFIVKENNEIYSIYGQIIPQLFKKKFLDNSIEVVTLNNETYYISHLKFKPFNVEIVFYDRQSTINKEVLHKTLETFKIAIIFIILILGIIFVFVRFLVLKPISQLIQSISKIANNRYEYITYEYTTTEFNLVKMYFNKMIDAIKNREQKIKEYIQEQEKRELFYYDLLNSQDNIIIVNDSKQIEHVNDAFFRFFDQFKTLDDFSKDHSCVCDFFEKEEGYIYSFEDKNWVEFLVSNHDKQHKVKIKKDDKEYIFNISAKKLQYSAKTIISLNDITTLEKEREKVLGLNILLEDYRKAIDAGIIVSKTDTKGIITYVNDEFCRISGYSKEELLGKSHNIVRHPDVSKAVYDDLWNTIKNGKIWKGEIKNRKKDGSEYYVKSIIAPLKNIDGEITEYIALREDITDLIYAINKAKEAEQVKMLFLSNMSHEIRTPLNGILGFTELLLKSSNLPEKEKRYINTVHSSSQALLQIINDVLDISKIESGKLTIEKKEFRPICSFKEAAELFKARAKEKDINYKIDLDFNLTGLIKSDEFRIRQVISNLIGNAIKFTPEHGEVVFSVKQIQKNENISTLCFYVKDTGIGIPKEKQKDIFQEFTQADNSVSRKYGGTGLGLSISYKIVKALGGELKVKSEEGKGSEFYFCIEVENGDEKNSLKKSIMELDIALYKVNNKRIKNYLENIVHSVIETNDISKANENDIIISKEYLPEYKDKLIILGDSNNIISIPLDFDTSDVLNALIHFIDNKEKHSKQVLNTKLMFDHKVLIAEDNLVNQELIKILLETKGLQYKIANNGKEAVELYKTDKFGLIFMDINMPEMDGIEATKAIKEYENENNLTHVPIIALTANSMEGDKDKFLQYMDDYLSKPIIEKDLNIILNKYLDSKIEVNNANQTSIEYNKDKIAKTLGIPAVIFDKVLTKFLETIDNYMLELENAIKNNDLEAIQHNAHKVKGSMMTFHLDYMVEILQQMEDDAKNKIDKDYMKEYELVKKELENFSNSMNKG